MAAWSSLTTYAIDAQVQYIGVNWVSLANGNLNHPPDLSPTWWINDFQVSTLNGYTIVLPQLQLSKLTGYAVSFPELQVSKLDGYAVAFPELQVSKLTGYATALPPLQVSKLTGYAVLLPNNRFHIFRASFP